jgi:hypothetical protein
VSDAFAAPPEPPARRGPLGCLMFVGLFLLGFAGIGAIVLLRAPGRDHDSLGDKIVPPTGYVRLDDAEAGAGEQTEGDVSSLLGVVSVPGFDRAVSRAWGKAPDEPSRGVVVLLVHVTSPDDATRLADGYVAAHGATAFSAPAPLRGFRDGPDAGHRYAQRVVFAQGDDVWVVSVITPARESDTHEVVRIALAQRGTG